MEGYNKNFLKDFIVILISILLFVMYQRASFDQTVLRNVSMEPFSAPIQERIFEGEPFRHNTKEGIAEITPIAK